MPVPPRRPRHRATRDRLLGVVLVAGLLFGSGPARAESEAQRAERDRATLAATQPSGVPVLILGIDGATFRVLDPLLEQGELPHFASLLARGSRAPLRSQHPTISPALWTTIATGHDRARHGILDFRSEDPESGETTLVTSNLRRTHSLWTLADAFGLRSGLSGWWVSWPPEPIRGWIVSDRLAYSRHQQWTRSLTEAQLVHPPELLERVQAQRVDPRRPPMAELAALADFDAEELRRIRESERPLIGHGPSVLKTGWCEQRSYEKAALDLLGDGQPDLTLMLLIATDPISHTHWHYYEPEAFPGVDLDQARRLGALVPNVYRHNDRILGELLSKLSPETAIFVVSDHGFQASGRLPARRTRVRLGGGRTAELENAVTVGQSGTHHIDGLLIAAGGPIRPGARFATQPGIADIAPTVLAVLGLPVGEDMAGRVLTELIEPSFWKQHPLRTLSSYEERVPRKRTAGTAPRLDDERADMLRALGYIEEPPPTEPEPGREPTGAPGPE